MNVFRIWTNRKNGAGNAIYIDFETPLGSVEAMAAVLNEGKFIYGNQLWTRFAKDDGEKVLEIIGERPTAIGPLGVANIETPSLRYVRFVADEQAAEPDLFA